MDELGRVGKLTIPTKFSLIPKVLTHGVPNLRGELGTRKAIEFVHATPLEYLGRWIAANEVFGDDVKLTAVVQWPSGQSQQNGCATVLLFSYGLRKGSGHGMSG